MYNKFIFINNNRRKKQEAQKAEENSQISFDMLADAQNESNNAINNNASTKQKSNVIFKTGEFCAAAASTIPCIISILFTLNAPIANFSFIDFSNISLVVTNGIKNSSFIYTLKFQCYYILLSNF